MGPNIGLYILIGSFAVIAVASFLATVVFSADRRLKRRIRKAVPSLVVSAEVGAQVRLSGAIVPIEHLLIAPMTGRKCVYYLAVLEMYRSSDRSGSWVEVAREEKSLDFMLRDPSGTIVVHMNAAQVAVIRDHHTQSGTFDDPTAAESGFLARHKIDATTTFGFNKGFRYTEGALEPDEEVGVLGTVVMVEGQRALKPGDEPAVLVSDDPSTLAPYG